jgi:hypothetical protein
MANPTRSDVHSYAVLAMLAVVGIDLSHGYDGESDG